MKVRDLFHPAPVTAQASDRLSDAATTMLEAGVGSLAVFDGERLVGILTERDLVRAIASGLSPRVSEIAAYMTEDPATASLDEDSGTVARRMLRLGVRHLPVVEAGQVVGMISARDLLVETSGRPAR